MKKTYIIGEIGQNHNGSVDIAKLLVDLISRPIVEEVYGLELAPMDAVKLTKRDLDEEMSMSQMNRPYNSVHSFGSTYGEHRSYLELSDDEHYEIFKHAKKKNLQFVETICAKGALSLLKLFIPDYIKIASRDLTNLPLLEQIAETRIPIIISTGMGGKKELDEALELLTTFHNDISILHCVSEYPTHPKNVNLLSINFLKKNYKDFVIGYSDHTVGISSAVSAVMLGAEIIEKHVTIDRNMKGTDQAGSLGPDGIRRMIRDIRLAEQNFGTEDIFISDKVLDTKLKLERSIATNRLIRKDEIISINDIHLLSPGDGYKWNEKNYLIGKKAIVDIPKNEIIYPKMLS